MKPSLESRPADEDGKPEKHAPRTIRFYDRDWDRIETCAVMRGMTTSELIRAIVLAAIGEEPSVTDSGGRLAPQIELIFRYTHILATALRDEMIQNGRGDHLETLIQSARKLQEELRKGSSE